MRLRNGTCNASPMALQCFWFLVLVCWYPLAGLPAAHREVAHHVQDVAATHSVAGHHGHDWLGQAAYLHLQVQHVEARHAVLADIPALASH